MNMEKFRQVNKSLSSQYSLSLITNFILVVIIAILVVILKTRAEIVIERPFMMNDRPMKMIRGQATKDVREIWSYNMAMLVGNMNPNNYGFIEAVTYSIFSPQVRENLMPEHRDLLKRMNQGKLDISFEPDNEIIYDPKSGFVTINGIRKIQSLVNRESNPTSIPYSYKILVDVNGFSPVIKDWKEGEILQ